MARYSWAATSSDTVDGSDRSAKKSLRFCTHSVSWKGSTGVVPFQAFLQLSTVRLYSFFAPKEYGMPGIIGVNVNRVRRVAPEPVPEQCLPAIRPLSRSRVPHRATPVAADQPRCEVRRQASPRTSLRSVVHEPPGGPGPRLPCRPLLVQRAWFFLSAEAEEEV